MRNKKIMLPIVGLVATTMLASPLSTAKASTAVGISSVGVTYSAHVQNIGWQKSVSDGATAGTTGRALRVEALNMALTGLPSSVKIHYNVHSQNVGWTGWKTSGNAGTTGRSLRAEAVSIYVEGLKEQGYDLQYKAHVQDIGWQGWVTAGETENLKSFAGTTGRALRVEAIQIRLVPNTIGYKNNGIERINVLESNLKGLYTKNSDAFTNAVNAIREQIKGISNSTNATTAKNTIDSIVNNAANTIASKVDSDAKVNAEIDKNKSALQSFIDENLATVKLTGEEVTDGEDVDVDDTFASLIDTTAAEYAPLIDAATTVAGADNALTTAEANAIKAVLKDIYENGIDSDGDSVADKFLTTDDYDAACADITEALKTNDVDTIVSTFEDVLENKLTTLAAAKTANATALDNFIKESLRTANNKDEDATTKEDDIVITGTSLETAINNAKSTFNTDNGNATKVDDLATALSTAKDSIIAGAETYYTSTDALPKTKYDDYAVVKKVYDAAKTAIEAVDEDDKVAETDKIATMASLASTAKTNIETANTKLDAAVGAVNTYYSEVVTENHTGDSIETAKNNALKTITDLDEMSKLADLDDVAATDDTEAVDGLVTKAKATILTAMRDFYIAKLDEIKANNTKGGTSVDGEVDKFYLLPADYTAIKGVISTATTESDAKTAYEKATVKSVAANDNGLIDEDAWNQYNVKEKMKNDLDKYVNNLKESATNDEDGYELNGKYLDKTKENAKTTIDSKTTDNDIITAYSQAETDLAAIKTDKQITDSVTTDVNNAKGALDAYAVTQPTAAPLTKVAKGETTATYADKIGLSTLISQGKKAIDDVEGVTVVERTEDTEFSTTTVQNNITKAQKTAENNIKIALYNYMKEELTRLSTIEVNADTDNVLAIDVDATMATIISDIADEDVVAAANVDTMITTYESAITTNTSTMAAYKAEKDDDFEALVTALEAKKVKERIIYDLDDQSDMKYTKDINLIDAEDAENAIEAYITARRNEVKDAKTVADVNSLLKEATSTDAKDTNSLLAITKSYAITELDKILNDGWYNIYGQYLKQSDYDSVKNAINAASTPADVIDAYNVVFTKLQKTTNHVAYSAS